MENATSELILEELTKIAFGDLASAVRAGVVGEKIMALYILGKHLGMWPKANDLCSRAKYDHRTGTAHSRVEEN